MARRFLSAAWHHLVMLNYPVDPALLQPLVPRGTELDPWQGRHYVSVVGFRFLRTRVLGLPIPFHCNFDEINLRFYVRRAAPEGWRRGVAFIKEIVPRWAIATVARWVYNENYVACRMDSTLELPTGGTGRVEYRWRHGAAWNAVGAEVEGDPAPLESGSEAQFITEHYWGYVGQRDGSTLEYRVEHPPWRVWPARSSWLRGDVAGFYGSQYAAALCGPPLSAFVADGSAVAVYRGEHMPPPGAA